VQRPLQQTPPWPVQVVGSHAEPPSTGVGQLVQTQAPQVWGTDSDVQPAAQSSGWAGQRNPWHCPAWQVCSSPQSESCVHPQPFVQPVVQTPGTRRLSMPSPQGVTEKLQYWPLLHWVSAVQAAPPLELELLAVPVEPLLLLELEERELDPELDPVLEAVLDPDPELDPELELDTVVDPELDPDREVDPELDPELDPPPSSASFVGLLQATTEREAATRQRSERVMVPLE
jgi:hypothetical protein